jgi:hypothetical protein
MSPSAYKSFGSVLILCGVMGAAGLMAASDSEEPEFNPNKMNPSPMTDKSFSWGAGKDKASPLFSSTFSGFDKSYSTKGVDSTFLKTAPINAKRIEPPAVTSMDKSYAVRSYPLPGNFTDFDKSSSVPLKSSNFDGKSASGFNRNIEMPAYTGPEAAKIKQDMAAIDKTLGNTKDLPDKQLSINEVKALLNRNVKPQGTTGASVFDKSDNGKVQGLGPVNTSSSSNLPDQK